MKYKCKSGKRFLTDNVTRMVKWNTEMELQDRKLEEIEHFMHEDLCSPKCTT